MTGEIVRSEQRITAIKRRGPGRPFLKGDPRINRNGVPKESLRFQAFLRAALAEELQKPSESNPTETKFSQLISRLVALAEEGVPWAVALLFERLAGKPLAAQSAGSEAREIRVVVRTVGAGG